MLYQADWILTLDGPPIRNGWIRVEGDRIAAMGGPADIPKAAEVRRFPDCVLLPGLINAHCHLELSALRGLLPPNLPFPSWVKALREATAGFSPVNYRDSSRKGIVEMILGGTTTVVDVGNTGEALPALSESPLRSFGMVETLGLNPASAPEKFRTATELAAPWRGGLAPHSAYACSPALLASVIEHQKNRGLPITLHAGESREEMELFSSGTGPLQDFCRALYPQAPTHRDTTPIRYLDSMGLLPEGVLLVHGNYLDGTDIGILRRCRATVVHCPSSHAFFGHAPFPYARLREAGVPVCLGTDSLASGDSLSMLDQMRLFRSSYPEIKAEEALGMATKIPAAALGRGSELGILCPGFKADLIAVRAHRSPSGNPYEIFAEKSAEVLLAVLNGKESDQFAERK